MGPRPRHVGWTGAPHPTQERTLKLSTDRRHTSHRGGGEKLSTGPTATLSGLATLPPAGREASAGPGAKGRRPLLGLPRPGSGLHSQALQQKKGPSGTAPRGGSQHQVCTALLQGPGPSHSSMKAAPSVRLQTEQRPPSSSHSTPPAVARKKGREGALRERVRARKAQRGPPRRRTKMGKGQGPARDLDPCLKKRREPAG